MNFDKLKDMPREELMAQAHKLGLQPHWKAKPETIIEQIKNHVFAAPKPNQAQNDPYADPRFAIVKEVVYNTEDQVEQAIAHVKAAQPKFTSAYNHEEKTVKLSCLGAEETINLSVPLRIIRQKAEFIKKGAWRPRAARPEDFGAIKAEGKNAYTGNVLLG